MTKTEDVKSKIQELDGEIEDLESEIADIDGKLSDLLIKKDPPEEEIRKLQRRRSELESSISDKKTRINLLDEKLPEVEKQTGKRKLGQATRQAKDEIREANQLKEKYEEKQAEAFDVGEKWREQIEKAMDAKGKCRYLAKKYGLDRETLPELDKLLEKLEDGDEFWNKVRHMTADLPMGSKKYGHRIRQLNRS